MWFMKDTPQKMKFSIKNFSSKCDQIRSFLNAQAIFWAIYQN